MAALGKKLRTLEGGHLAFWCPGCDSVHVISVSAPEGGNWTWDGNVDAPTFSPSILVTYNGADAGQVRDSGNRAPPARCHSFVRAGRVEFCGDCTHGLSGTTVDLPDFPADFST